MTRSDQKHINEAAVKVVISIAAHLAMSSIRDENYDLWRATLRSAVDQCGACPEALNPLLHAARVFSNAASGDPLTNAANRLSYEARVYFQGAAATSFQRLERLTEAEAVI